MLKNKKNIIKIITFLALGIVIIVIGINFKKNSDLSVAVDTYEIKTDNFTDKVVLRGTATPEDIAELSFPVNGRISRIYVKETANVKAGQKLGELSLGSLSASLREQQGFIDYYKAQKENLIAGKRPEEIQVTQRELDLEQDKLDQLLSDAVIKSRTIYTTIENSIRNGTDVFYTNPSTDIPKLSFSIPKYPANVSRAEFYRIKIQEEISKFEKETSLVNNQTIEELLPKIASYLETVRNFLDENAILVNGLETTNGVSQTNIDSWRAIVSEARTDINKSIAELQSLRQEINNQKTLIAKKQDELALAKVGPTTFDIKQIDAQIAQAEARKDGISAEISDRTITAPFSGIVTDIIKIAGEIASPGETIIKILSDQKLSFILDVPENDISALKIGQNVEIVPDSLGDTKYTGIISRINPAESIKEGVTIYEVTVAFSEDSNLADLKSGMTGDAIISLGIKENVKTIPRRFLYTEKGEDFVYLYDKINNVLAKNPIKVISESSDNQNLIIENLEDGQVIGIPRE